MFGSIRKQVDETISHDIETIIGKNTIIKGEISGTGNLRVDGEEQGNWGNDWHEGLYTREDYPSYHSLAYFIDEVLERNRN